MARSMLKARTSTSSKRGSEGFGSSRLVSSYMKPSLEGFGGVFWHFVVGQSFSQPGRKSLVVVTGQDSAPDLAIDRQSESQPKA